MQSSKTIFFVIVGLAIVAFAAMIGIYLFLSEPLTQLSPLQQEVSLTIVAAPPLKPWAEEAAHQYNQANPNTQVTIIEATDLIPSAQFQTGGTAPPAAWLAEASFVIDMAVSEGYSFESGQSVASSNMAWGGYRDKLEQLGDTSWPNLHTRATGPEGVKLVIDAPRNSAAGLAALISAAAAHLNKQSLTEQDIGQADSWLTETLGDRNAHIPPRPGQAFASVQGRTLGDLGLLSMATWKEAGLNTRDDFVVRPAAPNVTLDYPLALYSGAGSTAEAQQAASAFRQFLLEPAQQQSLAGYGFEPASPNQPGVQIDGRAARRLANWADRELR